jgi:nitroreductase
MDTPIYDAALRRRSVRKYLDTPVSRETLTALVKAATAAPSATNRRPWAFVAVTDPEVLKKLRKTHMFSNMNAPAAIVVCGEMNKAAIGPGKEFWVQDCSAAIENILMTALDFGLGTVWVGVHPINHNVKRVSAALELPAHIVPLGLIFVGAPAGEPEPRTQFEDADLHWDRY